MSLMSCWEVLFLSAMSLAAPFLRIWVRDSPLLSSRVWRVVAMDWRSVVTCSRLVRPRAVVSGSAAQREGRAWGGGGGGWGVPAESLAARFQGAALTLPSSAAGFHWR